jgi:hypothetical protein
VADRVARFLEEAKAELVDALAYYNQRTPGSGDRLLEDAFDTADRICEDPSRWPVEDDGYRRWRLAFVQRFVEVYVSAPTTVVSVAPSSLVTPAAGVGPTPTA